MTTIKNIKGTKAVKISTDGSGTFRAMYVQIYNGEEQVLQSKSFTTEKRAAIWGNSMIYPKPTKC